MNTLILLGLSAVLAEDPFAREGAAEYEILEFTANKAAPGLEALLEGC